jgi:uncharacterized protein (DUF1684 family)
VRNAARLPTRSRALGTSVLCALAFAAQACTAAPEAVGYEEALLRARAEKDRFFRESPDSPIPLDRRRALLPLAYFPPDPDYRVPAVLEPAEAQPELEMPTSTGSRRLMRRVGVLRFTLKGQPLKLTAFVEATSRSTDRLFVPFGDRTNGTETYPGGRYLDLDRTATGFYDLDFNKAYHPYCYYNEAYDCPYPPPENRLPVPVRAGERLPPARAADPSPAR